MKIRCNSCNKAMAPTANKRWACYECGYTGHLRVTDYLDKLVIKDCDKELEKRFVKFRIADDPDAREAAEIMGMLTGAIARTTFQRHIVRVRRYTN